MKGGANLIEHQEDQKELENSLQEGQRIHYRKDKETPLRGEAMSAPNQ